MAAAPSLTTNDADDDNKYFGVIEVDMDDIVNLSQFYGNNQSDHVVEFKKDVKSEELDTTEKEIQKLSKEIGQLEKEKEPMQSNDLRFNALENKIKNKALIQISDTAAPTLFDVFCKLGQSCMGCRRSEEEPLFLEIALIQADKDEDKENQH